MSRQPAPAAGPNAPLLQPAHQPRADVASPTAGTAAPASPVNAGQDIEQAAGGGGEGETDRLGNISRVWWLTPTGITFVITTEVIFAVAIYSVLLLSIAGEQKSLYYFQIGLTLYMIATLVSALYIWVVYNQIQEVESEWRIRRFSRGLPHPRKELALAFIEINGVSAAIDKIIGERRSNEPGMQEMWAIGGKYERYSSYQYYILGFLYSTWFLLVWGVASYGQGLLKDSPLLFWACVSLIVVDMLCVLLNFCAKVPLCFCFPGVFSRPEMDRRRIEDILGLAKHPFFYHPTTPTPHTPAGPWNRRDKNRDRDPTTVTGPPGGGFLRASETVNGRRSDTVHLMIPPEETHCAICKQSYTDGMTVRALPWCKHHFHDKCVDKWLRFTSCPICNKNISRSRTTVEPPSPQI